MTCGRTRHDQASAVANSNGLMEPLSSIQIAIIVSKTAHVCGHRLRLALDQTGVPKAALNATASDHSSGKR